MKRSAILMAGMLAMATAMMAQTPEIPGAPKAAVLKFETTHHDFGKIKEDDGPVTYRFKFTNAGSANLILTKVQPACGCTTSHWTKDSVGPGKEGYVDATYDVSHRPGSFNKSITIYANTAQAISLLTFSGTVLPHVKTQKDSFPYEMGSLRFEMNHINFDKLANNVTDTAQDLIILNSGNSPVTIKEMNNKGFNYIFVKDLPFTIPAHAKVKFPVHFNAEMVKDYGITYSEVSFMTTDEKAPEKKVSVLADIHQFVPKLTDDEKAKAARIFFPENTHDFGAVKTGDIVNTDFAFTNKGKKELVIFKAKASCGCTVPQPEKMSLKPGESSVVHVSFNSSGKNGREEKTITIYSNDPINPEYNLKIVANISITGGKTDASKPASGKTN